MASLKAGAEGALRAAILAAADSNVIAAVIRRYGMTLGARRFVAGEHIDECVQTLRGLNDAGFRVNTTLLGEGVTGANAAEAVTDEYVEILDRLASEELDASLAVKLTHLGLAIDEELARRNVERLARHARAHGISLRIDMEESEWVDATLRIFRRLLEEGHDHVGAVLQSYLYRSEADLESLLPLRPNLRIVKGAYLEPPEAAMPAKSDVDAAYLRLAERSLEDGGYTALATHDDRIIRHVVRLARERRLEPAGRFEFQMLYGVRAGLQAGLRDRGFPVLVAAPFGPDWYRYLMRRLAERPANVLFLLRNLARS